MRRLIVLFLFFLSFRGFAQLDEVIYQPTFEFNQGVYLTFDEFKNNQPSITQGLQRKGESILIYDDSLKEYFPLNPDRVWGYSTGRGIYISAEGDFNRLITIGAFSHFAAYVKTISYRIDPYGFQSPTESQTLVQFLLNFDNGKVFTFSAKNAEPIFQKDPSLWNEYKKYKGKKEERLFIFLRKYNERYPIYFPIN
ncbi:hypothetical protein GYB57_08375 [bacterium]|nr:hypothetical protein [bacterium]